MTYPKKLTTEADAAPHDHNAALRAENAALKQEIATLRAASTADEADAARDKAIRGAVDRETARGKKDRAELTAQLDALLRSSSEVRYRLNADWSELAQLSGGGFIPDTSAGNANWLEEYIPEEHRDLVRKEIARAIAQKDTYNIEHKVNRVDATVGWALSRAVPLFDEDGEIKSWMGAASDISDRKNAEEFQKLLNDELTHRIKNIFSMVQAITAQTLRQAHSLEEGRMAITARLAALSRAQDILTGASFAAADIGAVIDEALAPHQNEAGRINSAGPPMRLASQQVLGLSLAIHELATNAAKYGALSNDTGSVAIKWGGPESAFFFEWVEADGPRVAEPTRRGFGSRLITEIVASYFDGDADLDFNAEGLRFRLTGHARA
ncbi:MAG: HWE histidine kinase domain-containing protein [Rhodobacterales bacterium]